MNWSAINFDWNQVRAFLATLEEGSLSAAARVLGLTQPTLGRQVTALEESLGVTLFERAGRQLIPTPAALEMADHVRQMGEAATRLSLAATGQSQSVEGRVKITATEMYSAYVLPDVIDCLRRDHPGIVVEIVSTNSLSDLRRREADIAIRNTEPTEPDLIARRLKDQIGGLFGSRDLIRRYGPFNGPDDLSGVPFIDFGKDAKFIEHLLSRGVPVTESSFVAGSESHLIHWELARRGIGLGVNGHDIGDEEPNMERVLPDHVFFQFPVWLVAPRELRTNRRVRLVYDALAAHLSSDKSSVISSVKTA